MRKLILMVGLVLVAFACSEPIGEMLTDGGQMMMDAGDAMAPDAGAQPGTGEGMKFVGNSSEKVIPTDGLFAIYAACQQTFGAGHRMCTLAEILNTADLQHWPRVKASTRRT